MSDLPDVNSLEETAEYLRVGVPQLRGLVRRKQIGFLQTGRVITFTRDDITAYIESHRTAPVIANPFGLTESSARRLRAS